MNTPPHTHTHQAHHEVLLHDRKAQSVKKQLSQQNSDTDEALSSKFTRQLRAFENISGYMGVSVYSCVVYVCESD